MSIEKKISVIELTNGDIFDLVLDDVERTKYTYIIYEDLEKTKHLVVLCPYSLVVEKNNEVG